MEIDVFVLVACPENSLLDSRDFYRPVVTPFELAVACSAGEGWTGSVELDFRALLPSVAEQLAAAPPTAAEVEEGSFSLITGTYRAAAGGAGAAAAGGGDGTVAVAAGAGAVATLPGAQFLASRTWGGLERRVGETPVLEAVEGRSGIASGYQGEGGE